VDRQKERKREESMAWGPCRTPSRVLTYVGVLFVLQAVTDVGQLCEDVGRLFLLDMLLGE
jgi:hypothetical protein